MANGGSEFVISPNALDLLRAANTAISAFYACFTIYLLAIPTSPFPCLPTTSLQSELWNNQTGIRRQLRLVSSSSRRSIKTEYNDSSRRMLPFLLLLKQVPWAGRPLHQLTELQGRVRRCVQLEQAHLFTVFIKLNKKNPCVDADAPPASQSTPKALRPGSALQMGKEQKLTWGRRKCSPILE